MAFTVANQPPMAPVAGVAYDTGAGFYNQNQQARADRDRQQQNAVDASAFQAHAGVVGDMWRARTSIIADRERTILGAQVQAQRDAQNRAYDYYASQQRFQQAKDLYTHQLDSQVEAQGREFTLKQQRELAALDNALDHVNAQVQQGDYSETQANYLREQIAAKRAGVQPMPRQPEKPAIPGDWQPGQIKNIGGSSWYMGVDGRPTQLGGVSDPADAQRDINARTVKWIDPVSGESRGALVMPNGELLFPDEQQQKLQLDKDKMELAKQTAQQRMQQQPQVKPPTPQEIAQLHKLAVEVLETVNEDGMTVKPTMAERQAFVDNMLRMAAEQSQRMQPAAPQQAPGQQQPGQGPQPQQGPPVDPGAIVEAQVLDQTVAEAVQEAQRMFASFGIELPPDEVARLEEELKAQALVNPPAFPMQPPQQQQQQQPAAPLNGDVMELDDFAAGRIKRGEVAPPPPGTPYRLPGDPPGTVRIRGAAQLSKGK
jgi:hypothetical protein